MPLSARGKKKSWRKVWDPTASPAITPRLLRVLHEVVKSQSRARRPRRKSTRTCEISHSRRSGPRRGPTDGMRQTPGTSRLVVPKNARGPGLFLAPDTSRPRRVAARPRVDIRRHAFLCALGQESDFLFLREKALRPVDVLPSLASLLAPASRPPRYAAGRLSNLAITTSNASTAKPRIAQNTRGETSEAAAASALPLRSPSGVSSSALAPSTVRDNNARS